MDETDFSALYRELGTSPEVSVEAFRQAYRRRVGQLHPDHAGQEADVARLQWLNRLYGAATRFHRVHGRLPGACHVPRASHPSPARVPRVEATLAAGDAGALGDDDGLGDAQHPDAPAARGSFSRYYVVVALVAIIVLASRLSETVPGDGVAAADVEAAGARDAGDSGVAWITVGMDARMVRLVEGPPQAEREGRWDYGPSWIRFRCGKVVAWHSSPLRRLRARSAEAPDQAGAEASPGKEDDGC